VRVSEAIDRGLPLVLEREGSSHPLAELFPRPGGGYVALATWWDNPERSSFPGHLLEGEPSGAGPWEFPDGSSVRVLTEDDDAVVDLAAWRAYAATSGRGTASRARARDYLERDGLLA